MPEVLDIADAARQDPIFAMTDGKEIGRDGCRVPLPWTTDDAGSFGFSPAAATGAAWMPQPADWGSYGADLQARDATSMLAHYRHLVATRHSLGLAHGPLDWIVEDHPTVIVFDRGGVLVTVNFGPHDVLLDHSVTKGRSVLATSVHGQHDPQRLLSNSAVWLR